MAEVEMEGDWFCPKCQKNNFARRVVCFNCKSAKPGTQPGGSNAGGGAERMLEGDWRCTDCGAHNFAKRARCFGCNSSRYSHKGVEVAMLKGDWICLHCKEHNFARRKTCFSCNIPRNTFSRRGYGGYVTLGGGGGRGRGRGGGGGYGGGIRTQPQAGDWVCNKCSFLNFARRLVCFSCHTSKEASQSMNVPIEVVQKISAPREGDWRCPKCNENNFSRRTYCFKCAVPKPGLENTTESPSTAAPATQSQPSEGSVETGGGGTVSGGSGGDATPSPAPPEQGGQTDGHEQEGGGEGLEETSEATANSQSNTQAATKPTPQMLEGDWICPKCSEHNFARRVVCFGCSFPKNPTAIGRGGGGRGGRGGRGRGGLTKILPEDWICLQCQGHNFAWRIVCYNCGTPKTLRRGIGGRGRGRGAGRLPGRIGGVGVIVPGDWICQACRSHNFARRQDCFSCGGPK